MTENTRSASSAQKLWAQLTKPSPQLTDIGELSSARLAASFFFIIGFFNLIGLLVRAIRYGASTSLASPLSISFVIVAIAYLISRSRFYRVSVFLFSTGFSGLAYVSINAQGATANIGSLVFIYVPISLIVANSFLSAWAVFLLTGLNLAALLTVTTQYWTTPLPDTVSPIAGLITVIGLVLIILNNFRNRIERERLTELRTINQDLESLTGNLEQRVAERTEELARINLQTARRAAQLQAITDFSEALAREQNLNELFQSATRLINERFDFYHVGIFLIDSERRYAILQAANSEGGQRMLERGHRLRLGTGVVGYTAQSGSPRIALDVGADAIFFDNPDLPETRSELALPIKSRGETIGVLDVQSLQARAFSNEDQQVLSGLANQVSIAFENTRLLAETRAALTQVQEVYNEFTRAEWSRALTKAEQTGFRFQNGRIEMLQNPLSAEAIEAVTSGQIINQQAVEHRTNRATLVVPVKLRGEVIGVLQIESNDQNQEAWLADEVNLVEAVAERAAFALENARLFQDARRRATKERMISEATTKISNASNIENILQATARELERVLGGSEVLIRFQSKEQA